MAIDDVSGKMYLPPRLIPVIAVRDDDAATALEAMSRIGSSYHMVNVNDEESIRSGIDWWFALTGSGSKSMVIKPCNYFAKRL